MARFDNTVKLLVQRSTPVLLQQVAGVNVERWLNVELPRVESLRVDLLGEAADGQLFQFEFQTGNDNKMPFRMAEYYLAIYRRLERLPVQIVICVGTPPLGMPSELSTSAMSHRYHMIDLRDLDDTVLLQSTELEDNMFAILGRMADSRRTIRAVLARIGELPRNERTRAIEEFLVIADLRKLGVTVEEEAKKMPSLEEILENEVLGREYKKGLAEGRQEGQLTMFRRQIEKRFGPIPEPAINWLNQRSAAELETLSLRMFDAASLDELMS